MISISRSIALLLTYSLSFGSVHAAVEPVGAVVAARGANLGNGVVSDGATLYSGDRISTDLNGALTLRSGTSMVFLAGATQVLIHSAEHNRWAINAEITAGTIVFSALPEAVLKISVAGAAIRPATALATLGQVTILDRRSFEIHARHGPLKISYLEDTEVIPEGRSYRVELDRPDDGSSTSPPLRHPKRSSRRKLIVLFLLGGGVAAATGYVATNSGTRPVESPDCPAYQQCPK
jgi:hypothetical protein